MTTLFRWAREHCRPRIRFLGKVILVRWSRSWALVPLAFIMGAEDYLYWIGYKLTRPRLRLMQYVGCPLDPGEMIVNGEKLWRGK